MTSLGSGSTFPPPPNHVIAPAPASTPGPASNPSASSAPPLPPPFQMRRDLERVVAIWTEYESGLDNQVSIKAMEEQWGVQWRRSSTNRALFSRRNAIYRAVKEVIRQKDYSGEDAAQLLESKKTALRMGIKAFEKWSRVNLLQSRVRYIFSSRRCQLFVCPCREFLVSSVCFFFVSLVFAVVAFFSVYCSVC
ncbi:transcriptional activator of glycolytic enzymes-domain-containing protein [Phlyctochytrium arcticum]|nr:transcriptional activator of glycolytic enzymes-domain-containing protein [Phlyctochytrium arcticum]